MGDGAPASRPFASRAAAAYLGFFLALLAIWAIARGAGRVVVPIVVAILVGAAIARWLRSWWARNSRSP
ncbi:MAG: hypothetical protein IPK26_30850 [Planctomycetes bacterium]|nr:hypothetical protein [Planctomycetota bacterium]